MNTTSDVPQNQGNLAESLECVVYNVARVNEMLGIVSRAGVAADVQGVIQFVRGMLGDVQDAVQQAADELQSLPANGMA